MSASHDGSDLHLLVGAYAVHALDPVETTEFESHLELCESCARELAGMRAAAAELGAAVAKTPPDALRARVLAAAAATPQLAPAAPIGIEPGIEPGPDDDGAVVPLPSRPRRGQRLLAVAAAALLVVAGVLGWRAASLSRDLDAAQVAVAQLNAVLTASDATTASGPITGGGRGTVVASESLGQAVIVTSALPEAPPGKVYQLWYVTTAGTATPAGFLDADADGRGAQVLSGSMDGADAVGITMEPVGGSAAPTTAPVLALEL